MPLDQNQLKLNPRNRICREENTLREHLLKWREGLFFRKKCWMPFLTRVSRFSGINRCFWGSRKDNYGKKAYRSEFTYVSTHYSRVPITTVNFYKILFENYRFKTHPQVNKSFTVQYIQKFLKISFFPQSAHSHWRQISYRCACWDRKFLQKKIFWCNPHRPHWY